MAGIPLSNKEFELIVEYLKIQRKRKNIEKNVPAIP